MVGVFMQDVVDEWQAGPVAVCPGEAGIDDTGGPTWASGLASRGRVRPLNQAVEAEDIESVRLDAVEGPVVITACPSLQPNQAAAGREDSQFNLGDIRRPDEKRAAPLPPADGTQWLPSVHVRPPRCVLCMMQ